MTQFWAWPAQDQAWHQALADYRPLLCPCGCGHPAEISQAPGNEDRFDVHVIRCHARTAIARESSRRQETDQSEALLYAARLRDGSGM